MNILFLFSLLQISIYLFLVPIIRYQFFSIELDYPFLVALIFLIFFIMGGVLGKIKISSDKSKSEIRNFEFSNFGICSLLIWIGGVLFISIKFGLYDRRIGTENAAELFGSLPFFILFLFRCLEISLPMLLSLILIKGLTQRRLDLKNKLVAFLLLIAFFSLGAASSRSAILLLVITVLVIIQNRLPKYEIKRFATKLILFSIVIMGVIQVSRLEADSRSFSEYFSAEVVQRLDGLELISEVVKIHGLKFLGVNPMAALNPLISHLAFLPESRVLKSLGLTSIKSIVLSKELGSELRDYNSFILLDIYYICGLLGVCFVGLLLGLLCQRIDKNIFVNQRRIMLIGTIAIAMNLIVLEREFFSIIFSIIRDFIILLVISKMLIVERISYKDKEG